MLRRITKQTKIIRLYNTKPENKQCDLSKLDDVIKITEQMTITDLKIMKRALEEKYPIVFEREFGLGLCVGGLFIIFLWLFYTFIKN
jgi:hypothetical protein